MEIIERIFVTMEQKNIKQKDLAEALKINKSTIATWKLKNSNPPAEYLKTIAEILDVSIEFLITGKETETFLTAEQQQIINAYSRADKRTKKITELVLEPYLNK